MDIGGRGGLVKDIRSQTLQGLEQEDNKNKEAITGRQLNEEDHEIKFRSKVMKIRKSRFMEFLVIKNHIGTSDISNIRETQEGQSMNKEKKVRLSRRFNRNGQQELAAAKHKDKIEGMCMGVSGMDRVRSRDTGSQAALEVTTHTNHRKEIEVSRCRWYEGGALSSSSSIEGKSILERVVELVRRSHKELLILNLVGKKVLKFPCLKFIGRIIKSAAMQSQRKNKSSINLILPSFTCTKQQDQCSNQGRIDTKMGYNYKCWEMDLDRKSCRNEHMDYITKMRGKYAVNKHGIIISYSKLHKNFSGEGKDQVKEQAVVVSSDVVGTAANSTKVLSSGKVLGKPVTNNAKQEWMQARKNKYQRDKRGYIIVEIKEKEDNKGKGKLNEGTVISKNKFGALEVEEEAQPIMQITDGKGEERDKALGQDQICKENIKEKQLENNGNKKGTSPNPTANGIGEGISGKSVYKEGGKMSINKVEVEARKIKKDAVEKVNMVRESGNIFGVIQATMMQLERNKRLSGCIGDLGQDSGQKEDINEVNSAKTLWSEEVEVMEINLSNCQARVEDNSSYMVNQAEVQTGKDQGVSEEARKQEGSAQQLMNKEKGNGTVNPSQSGEILAFVDGLPVYSLEKDLDGDVPTEVRKDTMCLDKELVQGKGADHNGTIISDYVATVNPNLGSVYELQFKMMQENLGDMEKTLKAQHVALTPYEPTEQAIVARDSGELESLAVACASGTGSPMQIQLNMPLRSPNQVLHDIITRKELPDDIQQTLLEQQLQFEGEEDDESTAENFKAIAKEGDLSPKSAARSGKKGKKNQPKELQAPTRILPRRAASNVSR
ncbi:hypothetical protein A4A49_21527 [Nicotiana attenuata]|uniref:Uncharacterized protein n=1 Tax=Nicotiana attenuata TaxID=49451 RepID=A0A1J6KD43_NICAT|nr:hypothetical protein A4A49_21527 [Nicotiana attenuata]